MTGKARRDAPDDGEGADGDGADGDRADGDWADAGVKGGAKAADMAGADEPAVPVRPVVGPDALALRAGVHASPGPDDMRPRLLLLANAGSRVATDTSRGANELTVVPGRAREYRRTTGAAPDDDDGDGDDAARLAVALAGAAAGATERIAAPDAGVRVAVLRSR